MLMDQVTEMVAHMIGIFHITLEEERMRDVYEEFKALRSADPDNEPVEAITHNFKARYDLEDFTPNVRYTPPGDDTPEVFIPQTYYIPPYYPAVEPGFMWAPVAPHTWLPPFDFPTGPGRPLLTLEPPGGIAVITYQSAYLEDDDWVGGDSALAFADPSVHLVQLLKYQASAATLAAPVAAEMVTPGDTAATEAIALHTQIGEVASPAVAGASVTVLHGADAAGIHENGVTVEEVTRLEDVMPGAEEDSDAEEDGSPDPFEGLDDGGQSGGPFDIDGGHLVVAGSNTLVNEVSISSAWLDAPVISVMGDLINLDVIAQINLLVDRDSGAGHGIGSATYSSASLSYSATTPDPSDAENPPDTGLPSNWAVTRINGDLLSLNQVVQYSFQTDFDRADITFSSANTYLGLGENTVVNVTQLWELGFAYDLILVGGNMISVNWITQTNVLIDNDTVTYSGLPPATIDSGGNLLFNGASIHEVGVDTYAPLQPNFAAAADSLADGALTINQGVAHDSVFEGIDILRVLYIEGDFTTVNWIQQTNVLGDSDQVHLALDDFQANTGASANVTTGSNAVINLASINQYGTDSVVMVGGDTYDDALIYQADLIDTDADPLGVGMQALAPQAVAFLADGMLLPDTGPDDAQITPTPTDHVSSVDMLHTMIA